jgi:hypothetical protein
MWLAIELEPHGKVFSYHPPSVHPSCRIDIVILVHDSRHHNVGGGNGL